MTEKVALTVCEALVAYDDGDYARAVDLMWPIKYDLITIGGSEAQVCLSFRLSVRPSVCQVAHFVCLIGKAASGV